MTKFESQIHSWNGPGFLPIERQMATYLDLEVINVRRRSACEFDVDIDYVTAGGDCLSGWMPLVVLYQEWERRPGEIGGLVEAAGGCSAEKCEKDWDYIRDLDDNEKFLAICHSVWVLSQFKLKG
ncbi:hypothetical protein [Flavobacterium sp.]|uniref:hypothetical protein n=1 Tax=Flavobacterium sp. TaxID=239 RepID=UPI0026369AE9|nr:hypothetical protein [Flavobacterium sp.]